MQNKIGRDRELYKAAHEKIGGSPVSTIESVIERWFGRGQISADVPVKLTTAIMPTSAFGSVTLRQPRLDPQHEIDLIDHIVLPRSRTSLREP